jgi:hypothetical protein
MARWTTARGRGASRGRFQKQRPVEPSQLTPEPSIGELLASLALADVDELCQPLEVREARVENVHYVSSFNWLDNGPQATIIVPGL